MSFCRRYGALDGKRCSSNESPVGCDLSVVETFDYARDTVDAKLG